MPADNSKIDWCDVKLCPKKGPHIACKNSKVKFKMDKKTIS